MSQDPQGRSPGSLEWEAMGGDPFPDTSQDLEKTGQRDRGAEGKGEEDEIAKGREERPRLPGQVCLGKSFSSLGNHLRSGQVWRMSGKA